jgi:general secretion pathway protein G
MKHIATRSNNKNAFTLVELLVVIVIIGVLATLAIVVLGSARVKSRDARRISDIKQIQTALELYMVDHNQYPVTLNFGVALTSLDTTQTYMKKVPNDPQYTGVSTTNYSYNYITSTNSYALIYTLSSTVSDQPAGAYRASNKGINDSGCGAPVNYYGIAYNTVWIDINSNGQEDSGECWFKENLATTKKPDGTNLVRSTSGDFVYPAGIDGFEAPQSDAYSGFSSVLGLLYKWTSAMNGSTAERAQGLCPDGWHIPSDNEWKVVIEKYGGASCETSTNWQCSGAGTAMKENGNNTTTKIPWTNSPTATNISGLSIRGAGDYAGGWDDRGVNGLQWSSSISDGNAWSRAFGSGYATVYRTTYSQGYFFSVRCLK